MSLQSAIAAELPCLRAEAEACMTLTLAAYSPNGTTVNGDGYKVPGYQSEGSTSGKVQGSTQRGSDTTTQFVKIGEVDRPVLVAGLHIPLSAPVPDAGHLGHGWEYEVTAVGAVDDPALIGRRYLVVGVPAKSFATARRLDVVELP